MISKRHLHLHRYIESIYFAYCFGSSLNSGSAIQFVRWLLGHCSASRFTPGASDSVVVSSWRRCSWKMVETALAGTNGRIKPFACACVWALFGYGLSSWHHVKSDCCDLLCIYTLSKMFSDQFLHVLSTTAHCSTPSASKFFSSFVPPPQLLKISACLLLTPLTSVSTVSSYPFVPWCPRISPSTQSWASAVMPQMHKSVQLIACGLWPHIQTRAATKKSFWRPIGFLEVPGSRWTVCGLWSGRGFPSFCHAVRSWKPLRFYQISGNDTSCPAAIECLIVGCCWFLEGGSDASHRHVFLWQPQQEFNNCPAVKTRCCPMLSTCFPRGMVFCCTRHSLLCFLVFLFVLSSRVRLVGKIA